MTEYKVRPSLVSYSPDGEGKSFFRSPGFKKNYALLKWRLGNKQMVLMDLANLEILQIKRLIADHMLSALFLHLLPNEHPCKAYL